MERSEKNIFTYLSGEHDHLNRLEVHKIEKKGETSKDLDPVLVQPIGFVRNDLGRRRYNQWKNTESDIIVLEKYQDALYRLDEFSHIEVFFYLHEMDREFKTRIHPTGNPEYPLMGAFATHTPNRPSKIAFTVCELLKVDGNVLRVKGLDAYDGSPVLDIKSFSGRFVESLRVPEWINDLRDG